MKNIIEDVMSVAQIDGFLAGAGIKMSVKFINNVPYFDDDKEARDVYRITFSRSGGRRWSFKFGQSIARSDGNTPPNSYDVIACITKSAPGTFAQFCGDYGYDTDSISARKVFHNVAREYNNWCNFFNDAERETLESVA